MEPRSPGRETFGTSMLRSVPKITSRHDEEMKLLQSLHQHMNKRMKADADYAAQLQRINAQALKVCPKDSQDGITSIMQIWSVFLRATDKVIAQLAQNAQAMNTLLSQELQPLIKNKQSAHAAFNKDRLKAENDYHASCTEVDNLHRSYDVFARKSNKSKERMRKAKQNEQESMTQRYVNSSCRLHNCHNSYVLAITNANTHQQFYKTSLLPFVFDTFQDRMELHVEEWKGVMEKYFSYIDLYEVYEECNKMIYSALTNIDSSNEYSTFIQENRSKDSTSMAVYDFDNSLIKQPAVKFATAGEVVVNNLTSVPVREKCAELQKTLDLTNARLTDKSNELENCRRDLAEMDRKDSHHDAFQKLAVRISILEGEVEELKCKEACTQVQLDVVQKAVSKSGGEAASPAHFDSAVGDVNVDFATVLDERKDSVSYGDGRKTISKKLGNMFSKFKRGRTHTVSTATPSKHGGTLNSPTIDNGEESEEEELEIDDEPWYYKDLPRGDADRLLKLDGDYLVRYSETKGYVLTTKWDGVSKHFVIQQLEDTETGAYSYRFEGSAFPSIRELLTYYSSNQTPITKRTQAVLKKPVSKQTVDDKKFVMNRDHVMLDRPPIGKGNFGDVFSATLKTNGMRVAVKTCRSEHIPEQQQFISEAKILMQYDHPNIVRLLGVCAEKDPVYIVMELMPGGDFLHFLRKQGVNQTPRQLTKFALDAAQGMEYLASKNCIHRDLAARNCLVGENNDILKISDFGMSREAEEGIYTPSPGAKPIPVKWTAPEALNMAIFTSASDVWSYSILLFETFSCGTSPYPGMSNNEAKEEIEKGHRMSRPDGTPIDVYEDIMEKCWLYDPEDRLTFSEIVVKLKEILAKLR